MSIKKKLIIIFFAILVLFMLIAIFSPSSTNNELINKIQTKDIYNGNKTNIIGKMGYVETSKDWFKKNVDENIYSEFINYVNEQDYNYFVIAFDDDFGLYCIDKICLYQKIKIDEDGYYIPTGDIIGSVYLSDETGEYIYKEYSDDE
jgi:hypothetical protein